jgi:hypothetical protein
MKLSYRLLYQVVYTLTTGLERVNERSDLASRPSVQPKSPVMGRFSSHSENQIGLTRKQKCIHPYTGSLLLTGTQGQLNPVHIVTL